MNEGQSNDVTVDGNHYLRVNFVVVGTVLAALAGVFWSQVATLHSEMDENQRNTASEIRRLEAAIAGKADKSAAADRWTRTNQDDWEKALFKYIDAEHRRLEAEHSRLECEMR